LTAFIIAIRVSLSCEEFAKVTGLETLEMAEEDPFAPAPKPAAPLEALSVGELEARIAVLKAEIVACEALAAAKRSHLNAAAQLFGAKQP
jgi:uncharacterized small protein (DUF1192 family)